MKSILRFASDLHLEFLTNISQNSVLKPIWKFDRKPNASYHLALLGDISNPYKNSLTEFLDLVSPKYNKIIYIPGNHEYYNLDPNRVNDMETVKGKLENICNRYPNVTLLDNKVIEIDGIRMIGTTLWSEISNTKLDYYSKAINDYKLIQTDGKFLTPLDTNELNKNNISWLEKEIDSDTKPCIVLTHHAPLFNNPILNQFTSDPKYTLKENNQAFHNNLLRLLKSPVKAWLYGHTHYSSRFILNDVIVATNQLGYPTEKGIKFNASAEIDLTDIFVDQL